MRASVGFVLRKRGKICGAVLVFVARCCARWEVSAANADDRAGKRGRKGVNGTAIMASGFVWKYREGWRALALDGTDWHWLARVAPRLG